MQQNHFSGTTAVNQCCSCNSSGNYLQEQSIFVVTTDLCVNPFYIIKRSLGEGIYNTCFTYTTVTLSFWPVAIPNRCIISVEEYLTLYSAFKLCPLLLICKTHRLANLLVLKVTRSSYICDHAMIKHVGLTKLTLILRKM